MRKIPGRLFCCQLALAGGLYAQAAAPATAAEEIAALDQRQKLLQKQLDVLNAERALIQGSLPAGKAAAPTGTLTLEGEGGVEAAMMAYQAVAAMAEELARQLKQQDPAGNKYIIEDRGADQKILAYQVVSAQLDLLLEDYKLLLAPPSPQEFGVAALLPAMPGVATGMLSAIGDILAFFRTDVKIQYRAIAIHGDAVAASLRRGARQTGSTAAFLHTSLLTPGGLDVSGSTLLAKLRQIRERMAAARKIVTDYEGKSAEAKKTDPWAPRVPFLNGANTAAGEVFTQLAKVQNASTPLLDLIRAERLITALDADGARLLYLTAVQSGGANKTTKSFWRGNHLSHSGGSIVQFFAVDKEGVVAASGILGELTGFRELETSRNGSRLHLGFGPAQ